MRIKSFITLSAIILLIFFGYFMRHESLDAESILSNSLAATAAVETYSFEAESILLYSRDATEAGALSNQTRILLTGEVDRNRRRAHMVFNVLFPKEDINLETYVINDTYYARIPSLGWVKNQTQSVSWGLVDYLNILTVDYMNPRLVGRETINGVSHYIMVADLSPESAVGILSAQFSSESNAVDSGSVQVLEFREWIAEDTFMVDKLELKMRFSDAYYINEMNLTVFFYDYNVIKEIELPAEAEEALDLDALIEAGFPV